MKKLSIADKLAKKSFESAEFQKSWTVHMAAFGPILAPAFRENYQAKVHLTAVLNLLSSNQLSKALNKLNQLKKYLETDADKTLFLFLLGVYFELSGDREHMLEFYCAANEYGHSFPMPYLKAGKEYLAEHNYEEAYAQYHAAIGCYTAAGLNDEDKRILSSAYTNLTTCLMMMHRYDEAESALRTSVSLFPNAPGRSAIEAPLLALQGNTQALETCLATLQEFDPEVYQEIRKTTDGILAGTDPLFFPQPLQTDSIVAFWDWFVEYSGTFRSLLDQKRYEEAMTPVGAQILKAFLFLEETPYVGLGKNENGYVLELHDCYAIGIRDAYTALAAACPEELRTMWQFFIVH